MPRIKTALRFIAAAAFAVPMLLGLLTFCTFTFSGGGISESFSLSPVELITGKSVDFSERVLASSPLLGVSFFLIPLIGLIGCLIANADTRAAVTGATSLIGFAYIFFVTDLIIPSSVYFGKPLEQVFSERLSPDSVIYSKSMAGNAMWIFYLLAFLCAAATFIIFLREMRLSAKNADNEEYYSEDEGWPNEDEAGFNEIDEIEPPAYGDEDYEDEEDAGEDMPEEVASASKYEEDYEAEPEKAEELPKDGSETESEAIPAEISADESDPLIIPETAEAHETDIAFKKLNFNRKKALKPQKPSLTQTKDDKEPAKAAEAQPVFLTDSDDNNTEANEIFTVDENGCCPRCGAKLRPSNVFCKKCGARFNPKK